MINREILTSSFASADVICSHWSRGLGVGFFFSLPCFHLLSLSVPYEPPSIFVAFLSLSCSLCIALVPPGSVPLAGLAAHLSEVGTAAELELQYQRAVGHFIYIFAFWREQEENMYISFLNSFSMCFFHEYDSSLRPASSHSPLMYKRYVKSQR